MSFIFTTCLVDKPPIKKMLEKKYFAFHIYVSSTFRFRIIWIYVCTAKFFFCIDYAVKIMKSNLNISAVCQWHTGSMKIFLHNNQSWFLSCSHSAMESIGRSLLPGTCLLSSSLWMTAGTKLPNIFALIWPGFGSGLPFLWRPEIWCSISDRAINGKQRKSIRRLGGGGVDGICGSGKKRDGEAAPGEMIRLEDWDWGSWLPKTGFLGRKDFPSFKEGGGKRNFWLVKGTQNYRLNFVQEKTIRPITVCYSSSLHTSALTRFYFSLVPWDMMRCVLT